MSPARRLGGTTRFVTALLLAGCASQPAPPVAPAGPSTYVVLLADADGLVGKVFIKGDQGDQTLDTAGLGTRLDGAGKPFAVDLAQLQRDFGAAINARPVAPERFYLYFESGGARLTPESQALIPAILTKAADRNNPDVSVIGHSDTVGKAESNATLAYQRATTIANVLRQQGIQAATLTIESHGESNLLVPTPDETPEPRNRRVEVTLR
jgi:outer membrane protein OmpA-like peptidoglycan-associated protein